jgi:hypothetical protein
MPEFDLRYIRVAKYENTAGVITYTGATSAGDAMEANLELKFAEGRLYAEGSLAEYLKKCTGGTISFATKYIPDTAKKLMYGFVESTTSIKTGTETKAMKGLRLGKNDSGVYVGTAFVAPDKVDGVDKYTSVFVAKALFGPPAMKFKTLDGTTITFQTPTTSGEFLADDSTDGLFIDTATLDSYAEAVAWVDAKLPTAA